MFGNDVMAEARARMTGIPGAPAIIVLTAMLGSTPACTNAGAPSSSGAGTPSGGSNTVMPGAGGTGGASVSALGTGGSVPSSGGATGSPNVDGGGGAASRDASAPDGSAPVPSIFRLCGLTSTTGTTCAGLGAYVACAENRCGPRLVECFGPSYASDDFTGGTCSDFASCSVGAADPCHANCTPSSACQTCVAGLVTCLEGSSCSLPLCGGAPPGDGGAVTPPAVPDGGTAISGTCADLAACCASMTDASFKDACNQALSDARARAGDADCAVVYSTYRSAGACK